MIIREELEGGFIHTYSDLGLKIRQETGAVYDDAIDVVEHTYTETDEPVDDEDASPEEVVQALEGIL